MTSLLQDLRYGIRMLAKSPGFTAIAVLTLGLGIGATTAVFSVLDHVALRPLPYRNPDELVLPWFTSTNESYQDRALIRGEIQAWREDGQVFSEDAAFWYGGGTWTDGEEPISLSGQMVEANFFDVLGVEPFAGRTFSPTDARADAPPVAVVSYALWQGPLGGDPEVLGRRLTMNETIYTIIGVLPAHFRSPHSFRDTAIWTPIETTDWYRSGKGWLGLVARFRPGVTAEQAEERLTLLAANVPDLEAAPRRDVFFKTAHEDIVGNQQSLYVLMGAVIFVLLIACANLAHLLLARATTRGREMAVRKALGASGGRLARQLLAESLLLSLCGCALGVLVAAWALPLLLSMAPFWLPRLDQVAIDGRVFAFAVGLSILTALLFGMAPAMQSARRPLRAVLQNATSVAATSFRETRFRDALIVGEIALCLVLLVGAGLLIRTFWKTRPVNVGFNPENRVVAQLDMPREKYADHPDRQRAYMREALDRLRAIPSVTEVAGMNLMPFPGFHDYTKFAKPAEQMNHVPRTRVAFLRRVMPNYFRVLEIPIVAGSGFPDNVSAGSPPIAIVNQALAESFWPDESAVGQLLRIEDVSEGDVLHRVIGVARDTRTDGRKVNADPEILIPFMQQPRPAVTFVVKTQADSDQILGAVRAQLLAIEPEKPIGRIGTMSQLLWQDGSVVQRQFDAWLIGVFSLLGLVLAMVGVFGVIAYFISQRTREIGLRMALGAQQHEILGLVMRRGLKLVLLGILVGVAASLGLTRLIASRLADVSATDPSTFIAMSALLAAVASLAILLPARRAARIDPMTALRYE
jgi:putative ABC transport system permease protein